MRRTLLLSSLILLASSPLAAQTVTLTLDETVLQPKTRIGIGINGGASWTNFVGANLVIDSSFELPAASSGFVDTGWPWNGGGGITPSIETGDVVTGSQSQRLVVNGAPAYMTQGRATLPQAPLTMMAVTSSTYRLKAQIKADTAAVRVRLGVVNEGWGHNWGPEITVGTSWQIVEWDYVPSADHLLRGVAIEFVDNATYLVDDLVAWDITDIDANTGLSATYVDRLRELSPSSLRLGGLGVNGIPLESYLRPTYPLSYGPPTREPDLDLNTFLRLCREVGAQPFITVPPAFSDATSWQVGDLTQTVVDSVYVDHGNLVDYIGGDNTTTYGARREADGFTRWDQEFASIYFELGNELWGTPSGNWDMDLTGSDDIGVEMPRYGTYCQNRSTEMKSRPGWRANMKVGWAGRSPTMWLGGWPGSYDGTLVPMLAGYTDFHTIDLYYGAGTASHSDDVLYGALFAHAPQHEHELATMKAAYTPANGGVDLETTVYEGNATWGGYESDLTNPSALYYKEVSLGAAVSLVDLYAAVNRGGVTVNNHFHYGGNVWGATGYYPEVIRKPAFHALKLFTTVISGDLVTCTVTGSGTYDDDPLLTGETNIPYVACYAYKNGDRWSVLVVNRHRSMAQSISIPRRTAPMRQVALTHADINANNETSEVVQLVTTPLSGFLQDDVTASIPPHSAVVFVLSDSGSLPPDGGSTSDGGPVTDGGSSGDSLAGGDSSAAPGSPTLSGGCGCNSPDGSGLPLLAGLLLVRRRRRR